MIISDKLGFAFVHIPKCAGTSVKRVLRAIDTTGLTFRGIANHPEMGTVHMAHLTMSDFATYYPDEFERVSRYRSMAIMRDPTERFHSAIFQRLREFKEVPQSAISAAMIESEARDVISYLESAPHRLDVEHVHFNRQSDFIELDGERIVERLFSLDNMAAAIDHIHRLTGVQVGKDHENRTTQFRFRALRPIQRLLRDPYVHLVPSDRRLWIREKMTRARLYQELPKQQFGRTDGSTARFIREYYARDFELLAACATDQAAQAA